MIIACLRSQTLHGGRDHEDTALEWYIIRPDHAGDENVTGTSSSRGAGRQGKQFGGYETKWLDLYPPAGPSPCGATYRALGANTIESPRAARVAVIVTSTRVDRGDRAAYRGPGWRRLRGRHSAWCEPHKHTKVLTQDV